MHLGVDTGGTFTDVVVASGDGATPGAVRKVPSTPDDPADAVRTALAAVSATRPSLLAHGTTVATNALLQRRLARTALIATRGFADVIEIARQARPSLYDQRVDRPPALVPRALRFEVSGRLDASGRELEPFDGTIPTELLDAVRAGAVDAVAVCLLHADLDPSHERAVLTAFAAALPDDAHRMLASHQVSPEFREYERTVTTVADGGLAPVCAPYLRGLSPLADEIVVMTSAGGLVPLPDASAHPATLLVSGPAAGVRAASAVASACGFPDAVSFDMGGTSTDVCLVRGGLPEPAPSVVVGGYPIRLPSLGVHTIGAGGGSVARVDPGGALAVGPESAGAVPGPACYGRGGTRPTVTDADAVLGRIPEGVVLPGIGALDHGAAAAALTTLHLGDARAAAAAVVSVVDAAMERAVRVVSVEQGVDPRTLALVAFGGAGPMHACAVADALGMRAVIVPARAGAFSAVGLVCAPRQQEVVRSWPGGTEHDGVDDALAGLSEHMVGRVAPADVARDTVDVVCSLDCRYEGQSHELTVAHRAAPDHQPAWRAFHAVHEARNGFTRDDAGVEIVALRVRASLPAVMDLGDLPAVDRAVIVGPDVVVEPDCTMWVPDGWTARPGATSAWVLTRG